MRVNHRASIAAAMTACFLVSFLFDGGHGVAAAKFGDWSSTVNVGPTINSEFNEFAPHLSKDGLSLYFASDRPEAFGSFGAEDLWVAQRPTTNSPWGLPQNLGPVINTDSLERSPALSRDGHYLFFASSRTEGLGGLDLWVSYRAQTHDDFGWQTPVNLGDVVNSPATDAGPSFFENDGGGVPMLFIASNRGGGLGGLDLYVTALVAGSFQPPVPVYELNTPQADLTATVGHDGLEIVFASSRPGGVAPGTDLWASSRNSINDLWSPPVNLGAVVNSSSGETFPSLSSDRLSLYFNSNREDGFGQSDIYVSTRAR